MAWVFKFVDKRGYEVGFYSPNGKWYAEAGAYDSLADAMAMVNYLNGGNGHTL